MKVTDKLKKKQILAIPDMINKEYLSVGEIAGRYNVTWQAIWYWIKRLRDENIEIKTRSKGQVKMSLREPK